MATLIAEIQNGQPKCSFFIFKHLYSYFIASKNPKQILEADEVQNFNIKILHILSYKKMMKFDKSYDEPYIF
jgi:hypothetical protein